MKTRRTYMAVAALIAAAPMIFISSLARAEEDKVELMFVQTAEDLRLTTRPCDLSMSGNRRCISRIDRCASPGI